VHKEPAQVVLNWGPGGSLKVVGDIACTSYPELELEERRRVLA
jgi:hypothetical protein